MSNPVRVGLIGCGGIVQLTHTPSYLALPEYVQVVALADLFPENRQKVGDALGVPAAQRYTDHRELLAKARVDAVVIATPHHLHAEHVIQAAEAGVAIISEKPMAASLEQAHAIHEAVTRCRVPYSIVHNLLFSVPMQEAFAQLQGGKLGQPFYGRAQSLFNKGERSTQTAAKWRNSKAAGGGCIADTAYHEIYTVTALVGSPVRYVEAQVRTAYYTVDVDDLALLLLEHENGASSTVMTSWCVPTIPSDSGRWCEVHAPEGSLRVHHRFDGPLLRYTRSEKWQTLDLPGLANLRLKLQAVVGHVGYFEAAFKALASASETPTTVDLARQTLAVVEAARLSSAERRVVDVQELLRQ